MVDSSSVTRLTDDVGAAATAGMIDRFIDMLPDRVARLRRAVVAGEPAELRDASLSLGCSATMLGAHRLAAVSAECRTTGSVTASAVLAELERVAAGTSRALASGRPELSAAG